MGLALGSGNGGFWKGHGEGVASITVTLTSATIAAGDVLHVHAAMYDSGSTTHDLGVVTDNAAPANSYANRTASPAANNKINSARAVVANVPTTITVPKTGGSSTIDMHVAVYDLVGVDPASAVDTSTANTAAATTTPAHTAITSAQADELWIGSGSHLAAANTPTAPAGFTLETNATDNDGSTKEPIFSAYAIFSAVQTALAPQWSMTTSSTYNLHLVAYKAAAVTTGAAAAAPRPLLMKLASYWPRFFPGLAFPIPIPAAVAVVAPVTDSGGDQITFTFSGAETIVDSGAVTLTMTPSSSETIIDQGATAAVLSPTDGEAIVDQGTVTATVAPSAALEARADTGAATATVTPAGTEALLEAATAALTITPAAAAETIQEAGAGTAAMSPSASGEAVVDQGAVTATWSGTGTEQIISTTLDSGTITIVITPAGTGETILEANAATAAWTPTGAEQIRDTGTLTATSTSSGGEAIVDQGAVTATVTPTGADARADAGTATITFTTTGAETVADSGAAAASTTSSGTETIRDQGATTSTLAAAGMQATFTADAGTVTITITPTGFTTTITIPWGRAAGAVTLGPHAHADVEKTPGAAGTVASIPRVAGTVVRG